VKHLPHLFANNRRWAERMLARDPRFFTRLSEQQSPRYLWIGCSDSRVPANEIVDLAPGELFVHRNVANVVAHGDLNCLAVVQFSVDVLKVEHIIVCGHYGCGGVVAAFRDQRLGLADNWLCHVRDVHAKHVAGIDGAGDLPKRIDRLCELNVIEQVANVCQTTVVRDAWSRGQPLAVHGWIYDLNDGIIRDLGATATAPDEALAACAAAVARLRPEAP
jgi:carbonic anhydrase